MKLLLENNDLVGIAPTGSGKTLAFALPALVKAGKFASSLRQPEILSVIVCPTR